MQYQIRPPIPIPIRHAPAPPKESLRHPLPAYENPIAPARDLPASRKYRRSRRAPSLVLGRHRPSLARRASRAPSPITGRHRPSLARHASRAPSPTTGRHNRSLARRASRAPSPITGRHNRSLARRRPPPLRPNLAPHQQHNQGD